MALALTGQAYKRSEVVASSDTVLIPATAATDETVILTAQFLSSAVITITAAGCTRIGSRVRSGFSAAVFTATVGDPGITPGAAVTVSAFDSVGAPIARVYNLSCWSLSDVADVTFTAGADQDVGLTAFTVPAHTPAVGTTPLHILCLAASTIDDPVLMTPPSNMESKANNLPTAGSRQGHLLGAPPLWDDNATIGNVWTADDTSHYGITFLLGVTETADTSVPVITGPTTAVGGELIALSATAAGASSFAWTQTGGPALTLTGAATANLSVTPPKDLATQVYEFTVTATWPDTSTTQAIHTVTVSKWGLWTQISSVWTPLTIDTSVNPDTFALHDTFDDVADGTNPTTAQTGQTWGIFSGPTEVRNGRWDSLDSTGAGYLETTPGLLPIDRMGARWLYDDKGGTTTGSGTMALVTWCDGGLIGHGYMPRTSAHITIEAGFCQWYVNEVTDGPLVLLSSQTIDPPLAPNVDHTVDVYINDGSGSVVIDGTPYDWVDPRIVRYADENIVNFESYYNNDDTNSRVKVAEVWADGTPAAAVGATTLTATPGDEQILLEWTAVSGATGYRVGHNFNGGWETVDPAGATSRLLTFLGNGVPTELHVQPLPGGPTATITVTPTNEPATFFAGSPITSLVPTNPNLDAASADIATAFTTGVKQVNIVEYGVPIARADVNTPRWTIVPTGSTEGGGGLGPNPLAGLDVPIDMSWHVTPVAADGTLVVIDGTTSYEFYELDLTGASPVCTWAQVADLAGSSINPGVTGASIARLAGVITREEWAAGVIPHALVFSTDMATPTTFRAPAIKTDGSNLSGSVTTIEEGTRIQLDPAFDIETITEPYVQIVAKALQTYGAYCVDNGGARAGFIAECPQEGTWNVPELTGVGITKDYAGLGGAGRIDWSQIRVMAEDQVATTPTANLWYAQDPAILGNTRKVFTHWFPPFPIHIDNPATRAGTYYARNYYPVTGSAYADRGGYIDTGPIWPGQFTVPNAQGWSLATQDGAKDIQDASAFGIDGFVVDLITRFGNQPSYVTGLLNAASALAVPNFYVIAMVDCNGSLVDSVTDTADKVEEFWGRPSTYMIDGKMVVSSFKGEGKDTVWWQSLIDELATRGVPISLWLGFLNYGQRGNYSALTIGEGAWGEGSDPTTTAAVSDRTATSHASGKLYLHPLQGHSVRRRNSLWEEDRGLTGQQVHWDKAIAEGPDAIQLVTWNDYTEGGEVAPNEARGYIPMAVDGFRMHEYKLGYEPPILADELIIAHPSMNRSIQGSVQSIHMTQWNRGLVRSSPQNIVQVTCYLTAAADVSVTVAGSTTSHSQPAGHSVIEVPLAIGANPSATAIRGGTTVATVTSIAPVVGAAKVDDRQYYLTSAIHQASGLSDGQQVSLEL